MFKDFMNITLNRPFYDTTAILNSIVFRKTWGAQGANAKKNCRLWSRYIEILVDYSLTIDCVLLLWLITCYELCGLLTTLLLLKLSFCSFSWSNAYQFAPSASHKSIWYLYRKKVYWWLFPQIFLWPKARLFCLPVSSFVFVVQNLDMYMYWK
jgi:hypothetical protein